jgi:hypothetical protein
VKFPREREVTPIGWTDDGRGLTCEAAPRRSYGQDVPTVQYENIPLLETAPFWGITEDWSYLCVSMRGE